MYERFTDDAVHVVKVAATECEAEGGSAVRQTHLLLGFLTLSGLLVCDVLEKHGVTQERVRGVMSGLPVQSTDIYEEPSADIPEEGPPLSAGTSRVVDFAMREALQLGHNYIGSPHLLLGLIRQGEGPGVIALGRLDVDLVEMKRDVVMGLTGAAEPEDAVETDNRLLTVFLYVLMRDHVPLGVVEGIIRDHVEVLQRRGIETHSFTNGPLAEYAGAVADRLLG